MSKAQAYYNEIDPQAAQWLRNLISEGLIAPGEVDQRSIEDVRPSDLNGFIQGHFFAGIGVWSYALRNSGWPDDRPAWTGSCPCQPFSAAGAGAGFADERHLWPAWYHLISQCKPSVVFGEQVETAIKHAWLDLVQAHLERSGYAVGAVGLPAAGVGAPHIRQRVSCVADSDSERFTKSAGQGLHHEEHYTKPRSIMGDALSEGLEGHAGDVTNGNRPGRYDEAATGSTAPPGCTNGYWKDADWLPFRDGKVRPVEPGTFPMVDGSPSIVGLLRGYGNAIVAPVATEFIRAYMDSTQQ